MRRLTKQLAMVIGDAMPGQRVHSDYKINLKGDSMRKSQAENTATGLRNKKRTTCRYVPMSSRYDLESVATFSDLLK